MSKTNDETTVLANPECKDEVKYHKSRFEDTVWAPCGAYDPTSSDYVERLSIDEARSRDLRPCANCWPEHREDVDEPEEAGDDGIDRGEGVIADGGVDLDRDLPNGVEVDHYAPDKFVVSCYSCGYRVLRRRRPRAGLRMCSCGRSLGVTPVSHEGPVPEFWSPSVDESTNVDVREAVEKAEEEWDPEPASLRDGETTDISSHAARNLVQIRRGVEDGIVDEDDLTDEHRAGLDALDEAAETATADGGYVGSTDDEVREAVEDVDDDIDRGEGIITDGGVDVDRIPRGWEPNHYVPVKWSVFCHTCGDEDLVEEAPGADVRECIECDRLRGVTPIAPVEDYDPEDLDDEVEEADDVDEPDDVDWDALTPAIREVPQSGIDVEFDDGAASEEFLDRVDPMRAAPDGGSEVDRGDGPITDGGRDLVVEAVEENLVSIRGFVLQGRQAEAIGTLSMLQEDVSMPETRLREFIRDGREPEALGTLDRLRAELNARRWEPRPLDDVPTVSVPATPDEAVRADGGLAMSNADVRAAPEGIVSISLNSDSLRVPDSWARYRHERRGRDDGSRWYALLCRTGTREACGTVDGSGLDLPDRHEFGILVLYAREDGRRAFERWYPSEVDSEGRPLPDSERFHSSVVLPDDYETSSKVDPETLPRVVDLLEDVHGVEPDEEVSR